jgi:hypothetical protein
VEETESVAWVNLCNVAMYEGEDPLSEYDDEWLNAKWSEVITPAQNLARSATTSSPNNSNNNSSNNNNSNNNVVAASSSSPNPQSTGRTTRKTATALELPPEDVLEMSNQLTLQKQNYSVLMTRYQELEKKHVTLQKQVPSKPAQPSRAKSNRGKTEEKKKGGRKTKKEVSEESEPEESEESEYDTEDEIEDESEEVQSTTEESESDSDSSGAERKRKSSKSSLKKKQRKNKNAKESKQQKKKSGKKEKKEKKHKRGAEKTDKRGGEKKTKDGQKGEQNGQPPVHGMPMQYQFQGQPLQHSYLPRGPATFQMPPTPQHDPRIPMGYAYPFPQTGFPGQHQQVVEYCSQCENAPAVVGNLCSLCYANFCYQQHQYAKPGTPRMLTNPPKK